MLRAADTIWKTDTGRQRRDNEDNAFVRAPLFVVADGMGGAQAGEVASQLAVEEFHEALPDEGSAEERLTGRIRAANRRIYDLSRTQHEHAAEHPQRSIITRALGIEGDVEVDTSSYPMRAGDVVLLCSDGLTSMIGEQQIAKILSGETNLDRAADGLIGAANDAGGRDNITVVLFRLEEVDGAASEDVDEPTV